MSRKASNPLPHQHLPPSSRIHKANPQPAFCPPAAYLIPQRGILYFRMRVPGDLQSYLGRKEYRRSLGTAHRKEARPRALRLALALDEAFSVTRAVFLDSRKPQGQHSAMAVGKALTPEKLQELVRLHLDRCLKSTFEERLFSRGRTPDDMQEEQELLSSHLGDMLESIDAGEAPPPIVEKAAKLLQEHDIEMPRAPGRADNEEEALLHLQLCDNLQRAEAAVLESVIAGPCWDGRLRKAPGWPVSMVESFLSENPGSVSPLRPGPPPVAAPAAAAAMGTSPDSPAEHVTIKKAIDTFIAERSRGWTSKATAMDTPKRLQTFLSIIGENLTFAEFSRGRDAMRRYYDVMTGIPARYATKPEYRGKSWDELRALQVPAEERFKRETLTNNFNTVKGFLSWAEEEGYLAKASVHKKLLKALPADAGGGQKRAFTEDELSKLFSPEMFMTAKEGLDPDKPWKFLVPVLALFTGARVEELCQLELSDITRDQESGIQFIHITDKSSGEDGATGGKHVKTRAGVRQVPLHPFLMGQEGSPVDLPAYTARLREQGETRLFPMLQPNSRGNVSDAVTKWFTRYRRKCGVGEGHSQHSEVTFHSFRHTVITAATKIKEVDRRKVKQMVGHEAGINDAGDITARYEGEYPLSTIARDVIGALDFDKTLSLNERLAAWRRAQHGSGK